MRLIAILIILSLSPLAQAKDAQCEELLKFEKEFSKNLPNKIDEYTTLVEVSVNCTTRIVKYVKHLSVSGNLLAEGFQNRKQRQHTNLHCNNVGLATNGWIARDYMYDKSLKLILSLETTPSMCDQN